MAAACTTTQLAVWAAVASIAAGGGVLAATWLLVRRGWLSRAPRVAPDCATCPLVGMLDELDQDSSGTGAGDGAR